MKKWLIAALCLVLPLSAVGQNVQTTSAVTDYGEPLYDPAYSLTLTGTAIDTLVLGGHTSWVRIYSWDADIAVFLNECSRWTRACGAVDTADTLRIPAGIPWAFTPLCDSLFVTVYDQTSSTAYQVETQPSRK